MYAFKISDAEGRFSASTSRHFARKSLNTGERFSGFWISGVPFVAIKYKAYKEKKDKKYISTIQ
jgi:hypothetical protein